MSLPDDVPETVREAFGEWPSTIVISAAGGRAMQFEKHAPWVKEVGQEWKIMYLCVCGGTLRLNHDRVDDHKYQQNARGSHEKGRQHLVCLPICVETVSQSRGLCGDCFSVSRAVCRRGCKKRRQIGKSPVHPGRRRESRGSRTGKELRQETPPPERQHATP